MSLGWVIAGSLFQFMSAYLMFLFAVFAGGAAANNNDLSAFQLRVFDSALYLLPGLCVVSGLLVIVLYVSGQSCWSYSWHLVPILTVITYLVFIGSLRSG